MINNGLVIDTWFDNGWSLRTEISAQERKAVSHPRFGGAYNKDNNNNKVSDKT